MVTIKEWMKTVFKKKKVSTLLLRRPNTATLEMDLVSIFNNCGSPFNLLKCTISQRRDLFRQFQHLMHAASDKQFAELETKHILWSAVSLYCASHLDDRRNWSYKDRISTWWTQYDMRKARLYFYVVRRLLKDTPSPPECIIHSLLVYINKFMMWERERLTVSILLRPLMIGVSGAMVLDMLLTQVQNDIKLSSTRAACLVVRVIYGLFEFYDWPPLSRHGGMQAVTRLLKTYRKALWVEQTCNIERKCPSPEEMAESVSMRKGLEIALRRIIEHLYNSDIVLVINYMVEWVFDKRNSNDDILTFGTVVEHAALVHVTRLYKDSLKDSFFNNIMKLLCSSNNTECCFGNRILHLLLDRHDNRRQFSTPRIFFQNTHFNVNVVECEQADKIFLKKHRKLIHKTLVHALVKNSANRDLLMNNYTTICLIATEISCPYTAVVIANIAINIQGAAKNKTEIKPTARYHLHAITISIMSLLCWLHNAPDFYMYVNEIINLRAERAPHLNPPIRFSYNFAQTHALWDRGEVYFDVWKVRYSLWMRFKVKPAQAFLEAMDATAPPTKEEVQEAVDSGLEPSLVAQVAETRLRTRRQMLQPFLKKRKVETDRSPSFDIVDRPEDDLRLMELFTEESNSRLEYTCVHNDFYQIRKSIRERLSLCETDECVRLTDM